MRPALLFGFFGSPAFAQIVWTGAVSNDMFDEANWDLTGSSVTVIDPNVTIDDDVVVANTTSNVEIVELFGQMRFQIGDGVDTQVVFGIDVNGLAPGAEAIVDASVLGYPIDSVADIPTGDYFVQALLHRYETFHRSDGHVVKLPMDRGEGQRWNRAPGNWA